MKCVTPSTERSLLWVDNDQCRDWSIRGSTTGYINLAFDFVRENSKYLNFIENMSMRGLSSRLKEVSRGRWWISKDCCDCGVMASFLSTATLSCTNIEYTHDTADALVRENSKCLCLNICAAEPKPLGGARQSCATGQADLQGKIEAYGESKEVLQGGASAT